MSAKNWKFYYKKTEYESFFEKIVNALLQWAILVMLWASFWSIIGEVYPDFVPGRRAHLIWGIWVLLLWGIHEVLLPKIKSKGWLIWASVSAVHSIIFLVYYAKNDMMIQQGLLAVANDFLRYYNSYYQTDIHVGGAVAAYGATAFTFVVFVLWFIQWNLAYLFRKRWLYLLLPALAFVMELFVGCSPFGAGVGLFFLAALMIVATQETSHMQGTLSGGKGQNSKFSLQRVFVKMVVLLLAVISLLITDVICRDELALLINQKQAILALQDKWFRFESDSNNLLDIQFEKEELDNNKPRFLARKVLTMVVDRKPSSNIYLKGYNGNLYEDAVWSGDYSLFLEACNEHSAKPGEVTAALFQSGYEQLDILPNSYVIQYSIQYEQRGNKAYVPYFTDFASLGSTYHVVGDYVTSKGFATTKMTGIGLDISGFGTSGQYEINPRRYDFTLGKYSWYEDTVSDIYTEIPTDLWFTMETLGIKNLKNGRNTMEIAEEVKNYLSNNMEYSLDLDTLSSGEDPIRYFLTQSKEGYCMHFASAGTMMLRYLGVPARYVSGYVISQSAFYETQEGYVGVARDRNAHAWVEIFVEGIGWLPVEMTPGYESSATYLPTERQEEDSETTENLTEEPTETESETVTESESETESQASTLAPLPSETESEEESETNTEDSKQQEQSDNKIKELLTRIRPVLSAVLGIGILMALVYLGCRRWIRHYHSVLEHLVQKKKTRLAVRKMHRRVYRYLYLRKGSLRGLRDNTMEELLIATYPFLSEEEWRQYMEIAKKMYFSKEEISEEEMMHCYHCYKLVTNAFFKKQQ